MADHIIYNQKDISQLKMNVIDVLELLYFEGVKLWNKIFQLVL